MKNIKRVFCVLILVLFMNPPNLFSDHEGMFFEMGARSHPGAFGISVGAEELTDEFSLRLGISLLANGEFKDTYYTGITGGVRMYGKETFAPFVGLGFFVGYHEEEVEADHDGLDNDGDGYVDEHGEIEEHITGGLASIFPEVGFRIRISNSSQFLVSSQYHVTTEGRREDFWLYNVGISGEF